MKTIKHCLIVFLLMAGVRSWAQTNAPAAKPMEQEVYISSDSFYFDGITNQLVYTGHVLVLEPPRARLQCELLTVFLPADRGNPTNIVAETNVIVDLVDEHGATNHVTACKAVYTYQLLNPMTDVVKFTTNIVYATTNEVITFTGDPIPVVINPNGEMQADPLIFDVGKRKISTPGRVIMHWKHLPGSGGDTNAFKLN